MRNLLLMVGAALTLSGVLCAQSGLYEVSATTGGAPASQEFSADASKTSATVEQDGGSVDAVVVVAHYSDGTTSHARTILAGKSALFTAPEGATILKIVISISAPTVKSNWGHGVYSFG